MTHKLYDSDPSMWPKKLPIHGALSWVFITGCRLLAVELVTLQLTEMWLNGDRGVTTGLGSTWLTTRTRLERKQFDDRRHSIDVIYSSSDRNSDSGMMGDTAKGDREEVRQQKSERKLGLRSRHKLLRNIFKSYWWIEDLLWSNQRWQTESFSFLVWVLSYVFLIQMKCVLQSKLSSS